MRAIGAALALSLLAVGCAAPVATETESEGPTAAEGSTLAQIRARGVLRCAIHPGQIGMSELTPSGEWRGFTIDYCRALAAAVLGDPTKVRFLPTASNKRFTILQTGEADVLSRTTTWTLTRDVELGLNFVGVFYYDGQSFLVKRDEGIESAKDLDGAAICISKGTTSELNTADYFSRNGLRYRSVVYENPEEAKLAFFADRCDAMTTDAFTLTTIRLSDAERPQDYVVLPDYVSREPLGPVVRSDDEQWFDINKWVLNALIAAEDLRITQANVETLRSSSPDPEIQRLLGATPGFGRALGLPETWAYQALRAVGNYGEIYERNIAPLGVERGQNQLTRDGGLMYPLPMR